MKGASSQDTVVNTSGYLTSPALHFLLGLVFLVVVSLARVPILVTAYVTIAIHAGLAAKTYDDVTSHRHFNLILAIALLELTITCFLVIKSMSIGILVIQSCFIAVVQTLAHWTYLMTSSNALTTSIPLGEGRRRNKNAGPVIDH